MSPIWWLTDDRLLVTAENWRNEVKVVMKGGSWSLGPEYATVYTRIYSSLYNQGEYGGLRLAVSAVSDPNTGRYILEPSPFIQKNLREVRALKSNDMKQLLVDYTLSQADSAATAITFCGMGSRADSMSWEEIVRRRFTGTT